MLPARGGSDPTPRILGPKKLRGKTLIKMEALQTYAGQKRCTHTKKFARVLMELVQTCFGDLLTPPTSPIPRNGICYPSDTIASVCTNNSTQYSIIESSAGKTRSQPSGKRREMFESDRNPLIPILQPHFFLAGFKMKNTGGLLVDNQQ